MKKLFFIIFAAVAMAGCQKYELNENTIGDGSATLHVRVNNFEYLPFDTRAAATLEEVSSRLSFAIFDMNGERVMNTKSQTSNESGYGSLNINLNPGQYVLVTIAHNGEGNCTISSPTEIKFKDNKVTDTFTSCDTLTVVEGDQTATITLKRRVAMMRLLLEETLPTNVTQIKFYYTGGSSTLNANSGFGSVNSRQTELRDVPSSAYSATGSTYEAFTFPHEELDTIKLTITALDGAGNSVAERELTKVPVKTGQITQFRGTLTGNSSTNGLRLNVTIDAADWEQKNYKF